MVLGMSPNPTSTFTPITSYDLSGPLDQGNLAPLINPLGPSSSHLGISPSPTNQTHLNQTNQNRLSNQGNPSTIISPTMPLISQYQVVANPTTQSIVTPSQGPMPSPPNMHLISQPLEKCHHNYPSILCHLRILPPYHKTPQIHTMLLSKLPSNKPCSKYTLQPKHKPKLKLKHKLKCKRKYKHKNSPKTKIKNKCKHSPKLKPKLKHKHKPNYSHRHKLRLKCRP